MSSVMTTAAGKWLLRPWGGTVNIMTPWQGNASRIIAPLYKLLRGKSIGHHWFPSKGGQWYAVCHYMNSHYKGKWSYVRPIVTYRVLNIEFCMVTRLYYNCVTIYLYVTKLIMNIDEDSSQARHKLTSTESIGAIAANKISIYAPLS